MANRDVLQSSKFFALLAPYLLESEMEKIRAAYQFSKYGHRNQLRDDGTRYFNHSRAVAKIIISELKIYNWQIIAAALLHDIYEDSFILTERRIAINFGKRVALWVKLLTKEVGTDYVQILTESKSWQVLLLKLSDRLHNLRTLGSCRTEKQKRKLAETRKYYLPMADRLIELLPKAKKHLGLYLQGQIAALCKQHD